MKKTIIICLAVLMKVGIFAQAPQKMSYQAIIRDNSNLLVTSAPIGMRISIIQGTIFGASVYVETQNARTNSNGLASLEIGAGTPVLGTFSGINWATGPYFVKTETDPTGGTSYSITSTSQLLSVPYALFAANSTNYTGGSGISIAGNVVTNTSPDQNVTINAGTGINVSGSYPNYTITNTAAVTTPRIVYGSNAGGVGYTVVSNSGLGTTTVTFTTPFTSPPTVTATLGNAFELRSNFPWMEILSISPSSVVFSMKHFVDFSGGYYTELYPFYFIAIGN
jgi:hypothetical protein